MLVIGWLLLLLSSLGVCRGTSPIHATHHSHGLLIWLREKRHSIRTYDFFMEECGEDMVRACAEIGSTFKNVNFVPSIKACTVKTKPCVTETTISNVTHPYDFYSDNVNNRYYFKDAKGLGMLLQMLEVWSHGYYFVDSLQTCFTPVIRMQEYPMRDGLNFMLLNLPSCIAPLPNDAKNMNGFTLYNNFYKATLYQLFELKRSQWINGFRGGTAYYPRNYRDEDAQEFLQLPLSFLLELGIYDSIVDWNSRSRTYNPLLMSKIAPNQSIEEVDPIKFAILQYGVEKVHGNQAPIYNVEGGPCFDVVDAKMFHPVTYRDRMRMVYPFKPGNDGTTVKSLRTILKCQIMLKRMRIDTLATFDRSPPGLYSEYRRGGQLVHGFKQIQETTRAIVGTWAGFVHWNMSITREEMSYELLKASFGDEQLALCAHNDLCGFAEAAANFTLECHSQYRSIAGEYLPVPNDVYRMCELQLNSSSSLRLVLPDSYLLDDFIKYANKIGSLYGFPPIMKSHLPKVRYGEEGIIAHITGPLADSILNLKKDISLISWDEFYRRFSSWVRIFAESKFVFVMDVDANKDIRIEGTEIAWHNDDTKCIRLFVFTIKIFLDDEGWFDNSIEGMLKVYTALTDTKAFATRMLQAISKSKFGFAPGLKMLFANGRRCSGASNIVLGNMHSSIADPFTIVETADMLEGVSSGGTTFGLCAEESSITFLPKMKIYNTYASILSSTSVLSRSAQLEQILHYIDFTISAWKNGLFMRSSERLGVDFFHTSLYTTFDAHSPHHYVSCFILGKGDFGRGLVRYPSFAIDGREYSSHTCDGSCHNVSGGESIGTDWNSFGDFMEHMKRAVISAYAGKPDSKLAQTFYTQLQTNA